MKIFPPIFNYMNILKPKSHLFTLGPWNLFSYGKRVYTLYGYPLAFEMVRFNGMFIKELKAYAIIFLL